MACWSAWTWLFASEVMPPSRERISDTPATNTSSASSGVTHTRPNHHANEDEAWMMLASTVGTRNVAPPSVDL